MYEKTFFKIKQNTIDVENDFLSHLPHQFSYPSEILEMSLASIQSYFKKNINATDFMDLYRNNILHLACLTKEPNRAVIEFLLEKKMDLGIPNIHGITCFHAMCLWHPKHHELVMFLMQYKKKNDLKTLSHANLNCLHFACNQPNINVALIEYLLEEDVDPGQRTRLGDNALQLVCRTNQNLEVVKMLVNAGVTLDNQNTMGHTVFHLVCNQSKPNIALLWFLLTHNANCLSQRNIWNQNCFDITCSKTNPDLQVIMALLAYGFDANQVHPEKINSCLQEKNFQLVIFLFLQDFYFTQAHTAETNPNASLIHALCELKTQPHFLQKMKNAILSPDIIKDTYARLPSIIQDCIKTCHFIGHVRIAS